SPSAPRIRSAACSNQRGHSGSYSAITISWYCGGEPRTETASICSSSIFRCIMADVNMELPSGTVTFLFTDVEGSTKLLHELGAAAYAAALTEHRRILREAFGAHGGVEVDTQGDAFFVVFPTAPGALAAAAAALDGLSTSPIRVRMGMHTGSPHVGEEGYVGIDVHRA